MFQYPATELFTADGSRRVVWSQEEYDAALAAGCTLDKPVVESDESYEASLAVIEAAKGFELPYVAKPAASVEVETSATGFQPKPQRGRPRKNPAPVDIEV